MRCSIMGPTSCDAIDTKYKSPVQIRPPRELATTARLMSGLGFVSSSRHAVSNAECSGPVSTASGRHTFSSSSVYLWPYRTTGSMYANTSRDSALGLRGTDKGGRSSGDASMRAAAATGPTGTPSSKSADVLPLTPAFCCCVLLLVGPLRRAKRARQPLPPFVAAAEAAALTGAATATAAASCCVPSSSPPAA
jgi:hypothetical protein